MTADELFQILKEYYKIHNHFPTPTEFAVYSELPVDIINKIYKRWITQGKLVKKGNVIEFYKEDSNKLFDEPKKQEPDNFVITKPVVMEEAKPEPKDYSDIILRTISGIIGISLILCSIHFTFSFNGMSMKLFWGFILSYSIVTFMGVAFTLAAHMGEKYMKAFVLFLWLLAFIYSVFTAVSGQYNDFRKYLSSDKSEVVESKMASYNKQIDILVKRQEELLHWREQETEYSLNPDLKTENPGTWKTIQSGVQKLEDTEAKIEELQNQIIELVEEDVISEETVYSWLCKILHVSSDNLHFIMVLFPSVFIDLCSSVCLMYTFSKKKKKD